MATDVSIRVGVDGEKEFRSALSGINAQIKNLNSEMKAVVSSMTGMDDAEERAARQTDVLGRSIEATKQKISIISGEYDRAKARLNELGEALTKAEQEFGKNSKEATKASNAYNKQVKAVNDLGTQLNNATTDLNRMEREMQDMESAARQSESALAKLERTIREQESALSQAKRGYAEAALQYGKNSKEARELATQVQKLAKQLSSSKNEFREVSTVADRMEQSMDEAESSAKNLGSSMKNALAGGAVSGLVDSLFSGISSLVDSTMELQQGMGRLETNAQRTGMEMDVVNRAFIQFNALTGQADSSIEAVSNLLNTSFDGAGITQAVEALSGAVVRFPDTLNIESLADGLQETLATGSATGQFGELLDRLGVGAENFSAQLAQCSTEAEKQQLVLETLAGAGLNATYQEYEKNNQAMLSYRESAMTLQQTLAQIATLLMPAFTMANQGVNMLLQGFLSLVSAFQEGGVQGVFDQLNGMLLAFTQNMQANLPVLLQSGASMIATIVQGITENLPTLLQTAGQLIATFVQAFGQVLPQLLQSGVQLITTLVSGISSALPQIVPAALNAVTQFLNSITDSLPQISEMGVTMLNDLADGIIDAIPKMVAQLPKIITAVTKFIASALPQIAAAGMQITLKLAAGIIQNIPSLVSQLPQVINAIVEGLKALVSGVVQVGVEIAKGIWQGISSSVRWLLGKVQEWAGSILNGLKSYLGIHSPSRVFRDQVGLMIAKGMALGIQDGETEVVRAAVGISEKLIEEEEKLQKQIEDMKVQAAKDQQQAELEAHEKAINEKYKELEEAELSKRQEIQDEIDEMQAEWNRKQLEAQRSAEQEKLQAQLQTLQEFKKQYEDALTEIQEKQLSMQEKLSSYGELFTTVKEENGELFQLGDLEASIDAITRYGDALEQLKSRGVSDSLMQEITGMSVEDATSYTEELLSMTDEEYENYMALWEEKQKKAQEIAKKFYSDEMDAMKEEFVDKIPQELSGVKDEMRGIGINGIQGMIDGMYSKSGALYAAAASIVSQAIAAMQRAASIHSPSKKTAQLVGAPMGEGVAVGFLDAMMQSKQAIASAVMNPIRAVSRDDVYNAAAATVNGMAATGVAATQNIIIPVNLNGKQIAEIVYDPLRQVAKQRGVAFG